MEGCGGFADEARARPWERDTIVNVWSTTKTVTSLAVLMLADQGPVASPRVHGVPRRDVACRVHVGVGGVPAGRAQVG